MSKTVLSLATLAWLLLIPGPALGSDPAPGVVELPPLLVNEAGRTGAARPTLVTLGDASSSDEGFADLARHAAAFTLNDAGARGFGQTVTLRGLGNTPFFGDASAVVYLDDIPLASAFTFPSDLYDFGQLSIFRGPQAATQFGRAGDAGVVQLVSAEPGRNASTSVRASVGNFGQIAASATVLGARSDRSDASLSLGRSQRDGYIRNTQLGRDVDHRQSTFGRVRWRYRPAEDLEVSLHLLGQRSRDGAQALVPLGGPYDQVARGKEGEADTSFLAGALGISKHLAGATLTSTTSYSDWDLSPYSNRLVVFGGFNFDSVLTQSQRTFNEEVRYTTARLGAGAFFSRSRTTGGASRSFSGFTIEDSSFQLDATTLALFGRATFTPAPGWLITPGLRLERTAKEFVRTEVVPAASVATQDDSWDAWLPSLSANRHWGDSTDFTFTVARGYKAGGYSAYTGRADLAGYDPQRTWGIEVALATSDQQAGWNFTSRAYAYRVSGYQIERSFAVPATFTDEYLVVNARRARIFGLEIESRWRLGKDVNLRAVAGLVEVTLNDFTDPFTGVNYSGNRAPYAPRGNLALWIDYAPPHGFFCGAGLTWTGRTYYDEQETVMLAQAAYSLLEARVGFAFDRGDIRLFGRNLTGKEYYSSITPGVFHGTPGAPATWGIEVRCRW